MKNQTQQAEIATIQVAANVDWQDCETARLNLNQVGTLIEKTEAAKYLEQYLEHPYTPARDNKGHIFGFLYGLDKVTEFLQKIEAYNKLSTEKIVALRIYHAISERDDTATVPPIKYPPLRDQIIVPVLESGEDLYKVLPISGDDDIILGKSRPCPNQCGVMFID